MPGDSPKNDNDEGGEGLVRQVELDDYYDNMGRHSSNF